MRYKFFKLSDFLDDIENKKESKNQVIKLLKTFKCEKNPDLEVFLKQKALIFEKQKRARSFLFIDIKTKKVLAYYTISISLLNLENLPIHNELLEEITGYKNHSQNLMPCYLIGQLGKSDLCNLKIGDKLIKYATNQILNCHYKLGGRFIILDAFNNYKLLKFYSKNGFIPIEKISPKKESIKMIYFL